MGGMVLETNIVNILQSVKDQNKLHDKSLTATDNPSTVSASAAMGSFRDAGDGTAGSATSSWQYNW